MEITGFFLILFFFASIFCSESKYIIYNTSQGIVPGKLNVHLVPHTHDDVGWLKTIDQYYVGSNNSIQGACVQNVLDSLVPALLADKNRKFIYVEQAFFQRWWRDQSEMVQNIVKKLVSSGQLELINGGVCMHDEAAPHYIDMIDQTTLGHRFIKQEFGLTPRIGWQIDPFGHSAVQAYLLGAEVGFDSIFFGRIDYQDRAKRKDEKNLEFVWRGSKTLGSSAQIFAGAFPENYEPPSGNFYFEVNAESPIVQDDINLFDYNVQDRVNDFVAAAISQANITRTNHVMWTMGTDFKYQYATSWFRQMDKFIHYVNIVKASVEQSYSFYSGSEGTDTDPQASGAYIFRPDGSFPIESEQKVPLTVMRGPVLDEVHQQINRWIHQITRVYKAKEHAEVEFTVGPIPVDDGIGKEITTKISTAMKTNKTFYTDSNGRDFIKRVRDYRTDWDLQVNQPVAGNYYPVNLGIHLEDGVTELSVLVDRSVGGSSMVDGQIELMLHRRLLYDDSRGVAESLNEKVCVLDECKGLTIQGNFYLRIDPLGEGAKWRRSYGQEIYSPFLLAFTEQDGDDWTSSHVPTFSGMAPSYSLPDNIAILTLQELDDGKVLLRLAHLYETGEDKDLSVMARVELKKLFSNKKITKVTETSLSANQDRAAMEKKRLVWKVEAGAPKEEPMVVRGRPLDPKKLVVELGPMEIRTFLVDIHHSSRQSVQS